MPRLSRAEQLEAFRQQQVELAKRIKEAEAAERLKLREDQKRRETLIGRAVLDYVETDPDGAFTKALYALLAERLTRPADRRLFPALPARTPDPEPAAAAE